MMYMLTAQPSSQYFSQFNAAFYLDISQPDTATGKELHTAAMAHVYTSFLLSARAAEVSASAFCTTSHRAGLGLQYLQCLFHPPRGWRHCRVAGGRGSAGPCVGPGTSPQSAGACCQPTHCSSAAVQSHSDSAACLCLPWTCCCSHSASHAIGQCCSSFQHCSVLEGDIRKIPYAKQSKSAPCKTVVAPVFSMS